ncbi:MAG: SBBP repeat-containing protein, partial [Cyclobacteriaceae bacterium]|nr:SBBP repeat-containing protein [Cyclobacteriaceae bacterium]
MRFADANSNPQINGHNELPGKSNYFLGNNPDEWQTNIPNYSSVEYKKVYHGIDLVYYGNEGQLEYDFMVSPNGDPKDIVLHFDDQDKPKIDKQGNLVFMDKNQKLFMKPPVAYQTKQDTREIIDAKYTYIGKDQIGFDIGDYDTGIPLVIDPVIIFSTYLGNSSGADAQAIAVDSAGNAYITGTTGALKFPTTHNNLVPNFTGPQHVFITKMNAEGTELIYSTYFGGHNDDVPWGIAVDGEGNILVVGRAMSDDFPLVNAIQTEYKGDGISLAGDGFIAKLDPEGDRLVYSTYMGGDWDDEARDVAVDKAGNAFVTGITTSPGEFPFKNVLPSCTCDDGYNKAFVMKFSPTGNLEFSTCLGGEKNGASGYGIATDREDNV